jgi:hypothetical protein
MTLIPPSFSFKGDRQKSISLKAQARQFYNFIVNQAELGGIPFIHRSIILSDGSLITITSKKESIYGHRTGIVSINTIPTIKEIVESGLYLESGFLDLLSSAVCNENTFKPAVLKYNTDVAAYISSTPTPLQGQLNSSYEGQQLADNSESLAVGCVEKLAAITDECGNTYTAGGYCDAGKILMKKKCQALIPSSMFSGKIRLLVQAVYGSTRSDYSCDWDSNPFLYKLTIAGKAIQAPAIYNTITGQGFLITVDDRYYLGTIKGSSVVITEIILSGFAQEMISSIDPARLTDHEYVTRVECYALSTATFGDELQTIFFAGTLGTPLAHGWHFSWDGLKGRVILHEANNATKKYLSRDYRIELTPTLSGPHHTFTASVTIDSSSEWWPCQSFLYQFAPDYIQSDTKVAFPQIGPIPYLGISVGNVASNVQWTALIYCYAHYDFLSGDDEFIAVTQSHNTNSIASGTYTISNPTPLKSSDVWIAIDSYRAAFPTGGYRGTTRISVDGDLSGNTLTLNGTNSSLAETNNVEWYPNNVEIDVGLAYWSGGTNPAAQFWESKTREFSTDVDWKAWMVTNGYWTSSGGYFSNSAGLIDRGDGIMTNIYYGAHIYYATYDRHYGKVDTPLEIAPTFVEAMHSDANTVMVGISKYKGAIGKTRNIEVNRVNGPWGFRVIKFYFHNTLGIQELSFVGPLIYSRYSQIQFVSPYSTISDTTPLTQRTDIAQMVWQGRQEEIFNIPTTPAVTPSNWHYSASMVVAPLLGHTERSRQSLITKSSEYSVDFGSDIYVNHDYASDSAVGWA